MLQRAIARHRERNLAAAVHFHSEDRLVVRRTRHRLAVFGHAHCHVVFRAAYQRLQTGFGRRVRQRVCRRRRIRALRYRKARLRRAGYRGQSCAVGREHRRLVQGDRRRCAASRHARTVILHAQRQVNGGILAVAIRIRHRALHAQARYRLRIVRIGAVRMLQRAIARHRERDLARRIHSNREDRLVVRRARQRIRTLAAQRHRVGLAIDQRRQARCRTHFYRVGCRRRVRAFRYREARLRRAGYCRQIAVVGREHIRLVQLDRRRRISCRQARNVVMHRHRHDLRIARRVAVLILRYDTEALRYRVLALRAVIQRVLTQRIGVAQRAVRVRELHAAVLHRYRSSGARHIRRLVRSIGILVADRKLIQLVRAFHQRHRATRRRRRCFGSRIAAACQPFFVHIQCGIVHRQARNIVMHRHRHALRIARRVAVLVHCHDTEALRYRVLALRAVIQRVLTQRIGVAQRAVRVRELHAAVLHRYRSSGARHIRRLVRSIGILVADRKLIQLVRAFHQRHRATRRHCRLVRAAAVIKTSFVHIQCGVIHRQVRYVVRYLQRQRARRRRFVSVHIRQHRLQRQIAKRHFLRTFAVRMLQRKLLVELHRPVALNAHNKRCLAAGLAGHRAAVRRHIHVNPFAVYQRLYARNRRRLKLVRQALLTVRTRVYVAEQLAYIHAVGTQRCIRCRKRLRHAARDQRSIIMHLHRQHARCCVVGLIRHKNIYGIAQGIGRADLVSSTRGSILGRVLLAARQLVTVVDGVVVARLLNTGYLHLNAVHRHQAAGDLRSRVVVQRDRVTALAAKLYSPRLVAIQAHHKTACAAGYVRGIVRIHSIAALQQRLVRNNRPRVHIHRRWISSSRRRDRRYVVFRSAEIKLFKETVRSLVIINGKIFIGILNIGNANNT